MHTRAHRAVAVLATVACLGLVTGCGSGEDPETTSAPQSSAPATESTAPTGGGTASDGKTGEGETDEQVVITISEFSYSDPGSVAPGTEILVENEDDVAHTVTAEDGSFDITIDPGGTATFTAPTSPGEYPYICSFHANMSSTLVVQ